MLTYPNEANTAILNVLPLAMRPAIPGFPASSRRRWAISASISSPLLFPPPFGAILFDLYASVAARVVTIAVGG